MLELKSKGLCNSMFFFVRSELADRIIIVKVECRVCQSLTAPIEKKEKKKIKRCKKGKGKEQSKERKKEKKLRKKIKNKI